MSYENPQIPDGINVSDVHPLKDFFLLLAGLMAVFLGLLLMLYLGASYVSPWIPFSAEQKAARYIASNWIAEDPAEADPRFRVVEDYLTEKAALIAAAQQLPEDMSITVHFMNDEVVNAFATLGGHVMMHRGLLEQLPSENAMMTVLAHEIAHVKHRDPIQAMGRGVALTLAMSLLSGAVESSSINSAFSKAGLMTTLSFSREQERDADEEALATLQKLYGHTIGSDSLFLVLQEQHKGQEPPKWFSSHPVTAERIEAAQASSRQRGSDAKLTQVPAAVMEALKSLNQAQATD